MRFCLKCHRLMRWDAVDQEWYCLQDGNRQYLRVALDIPPPGSRGVPENYTPSHKGVRVD